MYICVNVWLKGCIQVFECVGILYMYVCMYK